MTQGIGHNTIAADQLRSVVERIEKLTEEKDAIGADIRDVFAEARGNGLCPKAIRQILKERKMDAAERNEREQMVALYKHSLGMLPADSDQE